MINGGTKTVVGMLSLVLLVLSALSVLFTASAPPAQAFAGGSGTPEDPYIITTVDELQAMKDNLSAHYALGNDIDASDTENWNNGAGFEPIGICWHRLPPGEHFVFSEPFVGSLDGRGFKIYNLYVNRPGSWDNWIAVGLFGYVGSGGVVKNVGMENENITGRVHVGGLVGLNGGTVSNCYSTGAASGRNDVGGLVGRNDGTVSNCYSTGSASGEYYVGGLVGYNSGTVTNSYSTGAASGIAGVGGLVGYSYGTVSDSFWDIETSGQATSDGGTGKTTENMKNVRTYTDVGWSEGLTSPWDFVGNPYGDTANDDIWNMQTNINDGYPYLRVFYPPSTPTLVSPPNNIWTNSRVFSATVTDPDGDNVRAMFVIGGTTYTGTTVASGSNSTYTHTADLNGVSWYAYAVDSGGATSGNSATWTAYIDTLAPVAPSLVSPADGTQTNDSTPTLIWNAVDDSLPVTYELQVDGDHVSRLTTTSYTTGTLTDGTRYWRVRTIDGAGNVSGWSSTWSFTVDTVPPLVFLSPALGAVRTSTGWALTTPGTSIELSGWVDDLTDVVVRINGETVLIVGKCFSRTVNLFGGINTFTIAAMDAAGNTTTMTLDVSRIFGPSPPPATPQPPAVLVIAGLGVIGLLVMALLGKKK